MLDGFVALAGQLHRPVFDDKYTADQAIVRATLLEVHKSRKLVVVFLPWHLPEWYAQHLQVSLTLLKNNVLTYYFNSSIIEANTPTVISSYEFIALSIASDIERLRQEKHYAAVDLLGISSGNVSLGITAEKLPHFNKVIMVVPGDSLTDSLWTGWRTRRLRNAYKRQGISLLELQKEWDILAPRSHIEALKGHDIRIILAAKDHFIPHMYGKLLVNELKAAHTRVTFTDKPFGHVATILSYEPKF